MAKTVRAVVSQTGPPQRKIPPVTAPRAVAIPGDLPTQYYTLDNSIRDLPGFMPALPARGYWTAADLPRLKLRGLGPADSLILRAAIAADWWRPDQLRLTPLIPWAAATSTKTATSRNLIDCPTAPGQPDAIVFHPPITPAPPPTQPTKPTTGEELRPRPVIIVEIKPNAGYVAFGQVLAYAFTWAAAFGPNWPATPAILTDLPRPYLPNLAKAYGVALWSLGQMIIEPPSFPT